LDYHKAFDSVDHVKLIEKLFNIKINIDWKMIKWISAFLQDRKMRVQVKLELLGLGCCAEWSSPGLGSGSSAVFDIHKRLASVDPQQHDIDVC